MSSLQKEHRDCKKQGKFFRVDKHTSSHPPIFYLNVQSLIANFEQIEILVQEHSPCLLMLSEARVTSDIYDSEIQIKGYSCLRCDSYSRHTGGVIIYVKKGTSFTEINRISLNDSVWMLSIKINKGFAKSLYTLLYRSPNIIKDAEFLDFFEEWCEDVDNTVVHHIIGDFNIDMSKETTYSKRLNGIIEANGMRQIVSTYTRITDSSSTLIDLVITNATTSSARSGDFKIGDHELLEIFLNSNAEVDQDILKNNNKQVIDKSTYTAYKFRDKLLQHDWNVASDLNLQSKVSYLVTNMRSCYDETVKKKNIILGHGNKWYTKELQTIKIERDSLYRIAKITNNQEHWDNYKRSKNYYNHCLKMTKNKYYEQQIDSCKGDTKKMWKKLKDIVGNKNTTEPDFIDFPSGRETEPKQIATALNDYFIDSLQEIHESIADVSGNKELVATSVITSELFVEFEHIDIHKLNKVIDSMRNTSSTDGIDLNIVRDAIPVIGEPLLDIINESFRTGVFPTIWKTASVIPIPKVSNSRKCEEFRPVNMLPTMEKIMEHLAKEQLENFIEKNGLLINEQSGFRKSHSCETSLNMVIANWKEEIEKGNKVVAVFLDLKRAFETIDRRRLINKLGSFGIQGTALNWIKDYLTNRRQKTSFKNEESEEREVTLGVPQGSVLGPLLFILYMNDIASINHVSKINLFADDTLISVAESSVELAVNKINSELRIFNEWFHVNKLKLNTLKTKAMIISAKSLTCLSSNIVIDDVIIECVSEIKYLGVIIDSRLSFKRHVDFIVKKVAKKIGFLGRIRNKLSVWARIMVYKTIISPHFEYCATVLFLANAGDIDRLQKLQNRAMRIILQCNKYARVTAMLQALQWLSVEQRIYLNTLTLIYKIINGLVPESLNEFIIYNSDVHNRVIRNASNFRLPFKKKSCSQNSLFYKGLKLYNEMSSDAKQAISLRQFRRFCTIYVKDICKV